MSVIADVKASIRGKLSRSSDLAQPAAPFALEAALQLAAGTGPGQADLVYADRGQLAASASVSLDLAGALAGPFGTAVVLAEVRAIMIKAAAGNTNNVVVGGAGSNPFVGPFADATDKLVIPPGGCVLLTAPSAGWTVTAGTGDILLIANSGSGTAVDYEIAVVGSSA
jgi:hypothetical protein